jgi:hypothetical protein
MDKTIITLEAKSPKISENKECFSLINYDISESAVNYIFIPIFELPSLAFHLLSEAGLCEFSIIKSSA